MSGFFSQLRKKIILEAHPEGRQDLKKESKPDSEIDNLIALGVLLWVVAEADEKFLPEEKNKIREILKAYGKISDKDMPIVLRATEEASISRIDLYAFTDEIGDDLSFQAKIGILENLFRIACIDLDLSHEEHEMIRKVSGLLHIEHKDFIDVKIKVKKEFGLNTAGL